MRALQGRRIEPVAGLEYLAQLEATIPRTAVQVFVELEVRELLSQYEFPGDDIPVCRVSALKAMSGDDAEAKAQVLELMKQVDEYIPMPARAVDKPFLMPVEDIFSISGRGTVVTGRVEQGRVKVGEEMEIVASAGFSCPTRFTAETNTPLAMAWLR